MPVRFARASLAVIALVLASVSATAAAQESPLATGAHIRVSATVLPKRIEGTFLGVERDTLFFAGGNGLLYRVPTASVTRVELGTRRRRTGVIHGAIWGAGAGCLLACTQTGARGWSTGATIGVIGAAAAIGAAIGALVRATTWTPVSLPHAAPLGTPPDSSAPRGAAAPLRQQTTSG